MDKGVSVAALLTDIRKQRTDVQKEGRRKGKDYMEGRTTCHSGLQGRTGSQVEELPVVALSTDVGVPQHEDVHKGEAADPGILHAARLGSQKDLGERAGILGPWPAGSQGSFQFDLQCRLQDAM